MLCIVAATQVDLRDDKTGTSAITTAQGERLARELKAAAYVECSAKTREGMQCIFDVVGRSCSWSLSCQH
jgi:hypothetical protein